MNNIVSCKLMGGLGNYLFQIAATYAYSLEFSKNFSIDISDIMVVHKPLSNYSNNILKKIKFVTNESFTKFFHQSGHHYEPIPFFDSNLKLIGHFQSEKYFFNFSSEIKNLFEIDEITKKYLNEKYFDLYKNPNCSIHVRRGDYLNHPNHHPVLDREYFKNVINKFDSNTFFYIFSDDLNWCKENFDFVKNKIIVEGNTDVQDLYLMSMCNDNIIANSSFSWWAAWLNQNENKKIYAPKNWFGPAYSHFNMNDTYPNSWQVL
jgi:hypothetical protein